MSHQFRAYRGFVRVGGAEAAPELAWRPRADIYRTERGWLVKFELAGVPPEDVSVHARERKLTVTGIRRDLTGERVCSHYLMEISYNRFERCIELPFDFDTHQISVEHSNGILVVRIATEGVAE